MADTPQTVRRSSFAFLSGTLISRVSGLGRDVSMAVAFGSHPAIAAFMVAFRFANLMRRLFGEGTLPAGFIPHFEEMRAVSPERGATFFRDLFFSLFTTLTLLVVALEVLLWGLGAWVQWNPDNLEILRLTQWMLPGVIFICLFGLSSGLLQCERRFFLTGFAPVAFNLVWIVAAFFLRKKAPEGAAYSLSVAVVIAFFLQWALLAPQLVTHLRRFLSWKACFAARLFSSELRPLIRPFFLGALGVGAMQLNSALDAVFARAASLEGPAYLWYAIRIEQLPLALFGIALSTALLPPLARAAKEGLRERYFELVHFAFRKSFSLIFPCTLGLFVLGLAGINLLYGHGDFHEMATLETTICLWGYGIGLLPAVFVLLLAPAFYAEKDYQVPMRGSLLAVAVNVLLSSGFVFSLGWGAFSIAVATSIAGWVNFFYLSYHFRAKMEKGLFERGSIRPFLQVAGCSLFAGAVTLFLGDLIYGDATLSFCFVDEPIYLTRSFGEQLAQFAALCGTFVSVLFASSWITGAEDVLELVRIKKKQLTM